MANNRMFLVHDATGRRVHLASHFAGPWKIWIEEKLIPALTAGFLAEGSGSTSWRIEYEQQSLHDDPLRPSTAEIYQDADGQWHRCPGDVLRAECRLETAASGYVAALQDPDSWLASKTALHDVALAYAAARGVPGALEQAELATLRRFRDGIVALRAELTACSDLNLVKETIDAFLAMSWPLEMKP